MDDLGDPKEQAAPVLLDPLDALHAAAMSIPAPKPFERARDAGRI